MKFVEQKSEILSYENKESKTELINEVYKHIERAARTCYKSEDKITADSAKKMVDRLSRDKHYGMLRHGTVYLRFRHYDNEIEQFYKNDHFSKITMIYTPSSNITELYVTTSYLVLLENDRLSDLDCICNPEQFHYRKTTFKFTNQLVLNREIQTHDGKGGRGRAEESTRYVDYNKESIGEISIVPPTFLDGQLNGNLQRYDMRFLCHSIADQETDDFTPLEYWLLATSVAEFAYAGLRKCGIKAEDARTVLPLDTKSELVYTLYDIDWVHVFELRCAKAAHHHLRDLMIVARNQFIENVENYNIQTKAPH